jgi:CHAT domain-containing protein
MIKNLAFLLIILLTSGMANAGEDAFCAGFIAGYMQTKPKAQIAPPCPIKPQGMKSVNDYKLGFDSGRLSGESTGLPKYILEALPKFPTTNEELALQTKDMTWQEKYRYYKKAILSNRLTVKQAIVSRADSTSSQSSANLKLGEILEKNEQWWGEPYGGPLYIAVYNPTNELIQRISLKYSNDKCNEKNQLKTFNFEITFSEKLTSKDIGIYQFRLPPELFNMKDEACIVITSADNVNDSTYQPAKNDSQFYFLNSQYETSKKIIEQKIIKLGSTKPQEKVDLLFELAKLQMGQYKYEDALLNANQAITLANSLSEFNTQKNIQLLKLKGVILSILGDSDEIIKYNQSVLETLNSSNLEDRIESLYWTHALIEANLDRDKNEQAIKLAREYYKTLFKAYSKSDLKPYHLAYDLIETFEKNNQFQGALELSINILDISLSNLGESNEMTLNLLRNLGNLQLNLGLFSEALATNERTVTLSTKYLGSTNKQTLLAMDLLGRSYGSLGRYQDKLKIHELATNTWIKYYGERNNGATLLMNSLASSYFYLTKYDDALQLYLKVFKIEEDILAPADPKRLTTMHNVVAALQSMNRDNEAKEILLQLVKVSELINGKNAEQTLLAKVLLAESLNKQKNYTEALKIAQNILEVSQGYGDSGSKLQVKALDIVGISYFGMEKYSDLAEVMKYKVALIERLRSSPGLSQENKQAILNQYEKSYKSYAIFNARINRKIDAFDLVELSKARTLLEKMSSQAAQKFGMLNQSERKKLELFDQQIEKQNFLLTQTDKVENRQLIEATRNKITREYGVLQSELIKKYPKYAKLNQVTIAKPTELSKLLSQNEVGINYFISGNSVNALTINAEANIEYFPLGNIPNLSDLVEILRLTYSGKNYLEVLHELKLNVLRLPNGDLQVIKTNETGPSGSIPVNTAAEISNDLSKRLIKPLSNELAGKSTWIISPDGPLVFLPFDALPDSSGAGLIIDKAQIQLTQSMSTYMLMRNLQKLYRSVNGRKDLFAMGNPDYLSSNSDMGTRSKAKSRSSATANNMSALDQNWEPLPGTEKEIKDIASLFQKSSDVFLGANATEQQLQKLNASGQLQNYRYMLFSAHGNLDELHPELSSIVLGLRNKTPQADGYVTASELTTYDLRSDLTVISACDSGVGTVMNGEGVMGLPFGLFVAGNVNTVLSLWKINDQATAEFMKRFFQKIKAGTPASEALTKTKREFIKDRNYSDPQFWAPFILVGAG